MKAISRLFQYLENKGIKHTRAEKDWGLSNGYLMTQLKRDGDLGEKIVSTIIDNCPDLSIEWLLLGKGKMLTTENGYSSILRSAQPKTVSNPVSNPVSNSKCEDLDTETTTFHYEQPLVMITKAAEPYNQYQSQPSGAAAALLKASQQHTEAVLAYIMALEARIAELEAQHKKSGPKPL